MQNVSIAELFEIPVMNKHKNEKVFDKISMKCLYAHIGRSVAVTISNPIVPNRRLNHKYIV